MKITIFIFKYFLNVDVILFISKYLIFIILLLDISKKIKKIKTISNK